MKIAHITATFLPYYSGTGVVCYHNAVRLAQRGHEVTVITANHPPGEYTYPEAIRVQRLPVAFRFGNAPLLPGMLSIKDIDIIHLHHPFIFGAELLWSVAKWRNIPFIITHHNDLVGDGLRPYVFDAYSAISARLVFGSARKLGAVSLDHAAHCRLAPFFKRRWNDVVEIPNGVDTQVFHPGIDGVPIRQQFNIAPDAPLVLFVGVLDRAHHFKGAGVLLDAFATLAHPSAVLMLVGDGELRPQFEAQAAARGIAARVRFAGAVPNAQTAPYYAAADLVVLPTAPPESFGMVLIEAMACARPVITSNLPGVRSVVDDGKNGLLTDTGDVADLTAKIAMLIGDPVRRQLMGAHGRAKVEATYAWSAIIPRLEQIYEEVLHDERTRSRARARTA